MVSVSGSGTALRSRRPWAHLKLSLARQCGPDWRRSLQQSSSHGHGTTRLSGSSIGRAECGPIFAFKENPPTVGGLGLTPLFRPIFWAYAMGRKNGRVAAPPCHGNESLRNRPLRMGAVWSTCRPPAFPLLHGSAKIQSSDLLSVQSVPMLNRVQQEAVRKHVCVRINRCWSLETVFGQMREPGNCRTWHSLRSRRDDTASP